MPSHYKTGPTAWLIAKVRSDFIVTAMPNKSLYEVLAGILDEEEIHTFCFT